jgi:formylmethanofuran dehydrogenase subunit C
VSEHVGLTLRARLTDPIEAVSIVPNVLATLGEAEIASLPVWAGRRRAVLGDFFDVRGERSVSVRIAGDVRLVHGVATDMTAGSLTVDGDAGTRLGAGMTGGTIDVLGGAGNDLGAAMTGGSIRVRGSAGHRVGAAAPGASRGMTGGEIVVEGSVGSDAGARMRRGLLFVGSDAGDRVARSIIAGTVVVIGGLGAEPAFASKRGTLVACGGVIVPETYRYACDYAPPHVRLVLTYLARRHGVAVNRGFVDGRYRRYCGDAGTVGKGEILEWIHE